MKCLVQIPTRFVDHLNQNNETGIGYQVVSVELKDGRSFDQVATSEGCADGLKNEAVMTRACAVPAPGSFRNRPHDGPATSADPTRM